MVGYTLSSEEFGPKELVTNAQLAEKYGFDFIGLSDHFHPWTTNQGNSPYAWTVIGAVAQATSKIQLLMEVTCPILRYHPAIIAQAAATTQLLSNGRFIFGIGTGENLNEHVVGLGWPPITLRQDMLREATDIMRQLFTGNEISYYGTHFTVEDAKLFSLPDELPPIVVSAFGPKAAKLAGQIGDGFVSTSPDKSLIDTFQSAGGTGKPTYAQINVCYTTNAEDAKATAFTYWPNSGLKGQLNTELRLTQYFDQATQMLTPESATEDITLGEDPKDYIKVYQKYRQAGFEHLYFHQIGPDQEGFMQFYQKQLKSKVT